MSRSCCTVQLRWLMLVKMNGSRAWAAWAGWAARTPIADTDYLLEACLLLFATLASLFAAQINIYTRIHNAISLSGHSSQIKLVGAGHFIMKYHAQYEWDAVATFSTTSLFTASGAQRSFNFCARNKFYKIVFIEAHWQCSVLNLLDPGSCLRHHTLIST